MNENILKSIIREALNCMDCQKWLESHLTPEQKEILDRIKAGKKGS